MKTYYFSRLGSKVCYSQNFCPFWYTEFCTKVCEQLLFIIEKWLDRLSLKQLNKIITRNYSVAVTNELHAEDETSLRKKRSSSINARVVVFSILHLCYKIIYLEA